MACEVICCEVSSMIDIIVEAKNGVLLNKLFSMVTSEKLIENRLAGYFEKTLQVLFKRKSLAVLSYLDSKGSELFRSFCRQLHNYSIMQAMRILLLPAVQLSREDSAVGYMMEETELTTTPTSSLVCLWHKDKTLITYLVEQLTKMNLTSSDDIMSQDRQAHISELLISVIDLSTRESIFHTTMTSAATIEALATVAVPNLPDNFDPLKDGSSLELDSNKAAVLSVLEVVVMQFCDENSRMIAELASAEKIANPNKDADATKAMMEELLKSATVPSSEAIEVLCKLIPRVAVYLKGASSPPTEEFTVLTQSGVKLPKLGLGRLRLVNLIESLLRLNNGKIDEMLHTHQCLLSVIDLFFKHEWHSLLHQGAMSCVMLVVEVKQTLHNLLSPIYVSIPPPPLLFLLSCPLYICVNTN
jgi:hypothetical protein